jgi:hypothetical protein
MTAAKGDPPRRATGVGDGGATFPAIDPNLFGAAYGQTMLEMQREWLTGMGQIQRDYLTFLGDRMRKDIEIAKRMAECRDMQAAMQLQTAFVETAREDYMEEAQKLLALGREITEHCVERLAEVPAKTNGGASSATN